MDLGVRASGRMTRDWDERSVPATPGAVMLSPPDTTDHFVTSDAGYAEATVAESVNFS